MYAVFSTGGKQYKAKQGDLLKVETLGAEEGEPIEVESVQALIKKEGLEVNPKAKVTLEIVKNYRDDKITVFKMKRRKGYRRTQGHRQNVSLVRVKEIKG